MSQNDHSIRTGIPAIVKCGRASAIDTTIRRTRAERAPPADARAPASRLRWGMGAQPPKKVRSRSRYDGAPAIRGDQRHPPVLRGGWAPIRSARAVRARLAGVL